MDPFNFAMHLEPPQVVALACVAIAVAVYAIRWYTDPLRAIPTVGGTRVPGLSYLMAWYAPPDFNKLLDQGCRRYPNSAFKIAHYLDTWTVVVSGRSIIEDLTKRPDDELSAPLGRMEAMQTQYLLDPSVLSNRYHLQIVKEKLARILPNILPDVVDEVSVAVREHIAAAENEWTSIRVTPAMREIVAQATTRAFAGLPLCRDRHYLAQAIAFAVHVRVDGAALRTVPSFIKPLAALFVRNVRDHTDRAVLRVGPIIEKRMKAMREWGSEWNDKPSDMLQFILDRAVPMGESSTIIVQRLMALNFATIFTSAHTASHVLYHLAAQPELVAPLREEIEARIATDGWTVAGLRGMWKLDSILRETLRYHELSPLVMGRKAMKDLTLSDGTPIPRGTILAAAAHATHHDSTTLDHADKFDAFRYARMRSAMAPGDVKSLKHQFTTTSPEYIPFGHGLHACTGRYFAAQELKAILARIVLDYDLKLDEDGARPAKVYYRANAVPAPDDRVLFRRRRTSV